MNTSSVSFDPIPEQSDALLTADDAGQSRRTQHELGLAVHSIDPLSDDRWSTFVASHPQSSIFHTHEWLQALQKTYAYRPVAYTTSTGNRLDSGMIFCLVNSWLTGRRLVSLPFADHCQPLASGRDLDAILSHVSKRRQTERMRYVELRPLVSESSNPGFITSGRTNFQRIDLTQNLETIYRRFHDSCIRRKIKRAEREKLVYECGRSEVLLGKFRALFLLTRRRHKLPPQPALWFRNLVECFGSKLEIHLASQGDIPVASIITLRHRNQLTYKYGCSDMRFSSLGGTPLLFWKAIQQAKQSGLEEFDLGRSDYSDPGLIAFKEHLGATSTELTYYRNAAGVRQPKANTGRSNWAGHIFTRLPDPLLETAGNLLYRHLG